MPWYTAFGTLPLLFLQLPLFGKVRRGIIYVQLLGIFVIMVVILALFSTVLSCYYFVCSLILPLFLCCLLLVAS